MLKNIKKYRKEVRHEKEAPKITQIAAECNFLHPDFYFDSLSIRMYLIG